MTIIDVELGLWLECEDPGFDKQLANQNYHVSEECKCDIIKKANCL